MQYSVKEAERFTPPMFLYPRRTERSRRKLSTFHCCMVGIRLATSYSLGKTGVKGFTQSGTVGWQTTPTTLSSGLKHSTSIVAHVKQKTARLSPF